MKQTKRFIAIIACALFTMSTWAQTMTFTYAGGATATASEMADGSYLMQLPAGTDLNSAITGVKVNGTAVDAGSVVPNPTETFITEGEIETFVYDGKAYSFRFIAGGYFTVVMFGDPHVAESSGIPVDDMKAKVTSILNMNKEGGPQVTFANAPKGYVPTTDFVICLGDMDKDSENNGNNFKNAMKGFNEAGIPFITIAGNHDIVPDYWDDAEDGTAGSIGLSWGGQYANTVALDLIESQYTEAAKYGGFTVETITDPYLGNSVTQMNHFTFIFRNVRFYCANNYWFQKPYSGSTYYAADGTINALNTFVEEHANDASIWVSHFPFYSQANDRNDAAARWWLDQSGAGHSDDGKKTPRCVLPTDAANSEYYNGGTFVSYLTTEGKTLAHKKKKALADIIVKTKNPRHFSGHSHKNDGADVTANNGKVFRDHTIRNFVNHEAFVVLCKEGEGVVEVKPVTF